MICWQVHPTHPQTRMLEQAHVILKKDGIIIYPTDSSYALGCNINNKAGIKRIQTIRQLDKQHYLTLVCRDLSELANYARVNNRAFRSLKQHTPGPYTFLLDATREVPRLILQGKRRVIGLRIPDHPVTQALLRTIETPLLSTSLIMPGECSPLSDPEQIQARLGTQIDGFIDTGFGGMEPTTVVDLCNDQAHVVRIGKGDPSAWE
jgi:tRNA threonylcarbamoyl adenosine modification protein (Sua5/YciO/YrdC/YwlC family)